MKIADYGKAITSYIESPTTAQKLQAKEKAQTLGRTFLAEGSEDIVEPSKSMQVDTTTKGPDLFTLDKFKDKAEIYVGALYNGALPTADIKSCTTLIASSTVNVSSLSPCLVNLFNACLLYTSPSPRDRQKSRMPSSA